MSRVGGFQVMFLCPTLHVSGQWILGSVSVSYSPGLRSVDFRFSGLLSMSWVSGFQFQFLCPTLLVSGRWILG